MHTIDILDTDIARELDALEELFALPADDSDRSGYIYAYRY
ncbi:hypothetical protein ACFVAV_10265 [Nocardia sp. NPDC057663]